MRSRGPCGWRARASSRPEAEVFREWDAFHVSSRWANEFSAPWAKDVEWHRKERQAEEAARLGLCEHCAALVAAEEACHQIKAA